MTSLLQRNAGIVILIPNIILFMANCRYVAIDDYLRQRELLVPVAE